MTDNPPMTRNGFEVPRGTLLVVGAVTGSSWVVAVCEVGTRGVFGGSLAVVGGGANGITSGGRDIWDDVDCGEPNTD